MKFIARIEVFGRYDGWSHEYIEFEADDIKEAEGIARRKGDRIAYENAADTFRVSDVYPTTE